jgi:arrestin-related trafficking adapter 4/5/7
LDPAALELAHAMTVENVWPNKVEYSLQIPQKAVIFGTNIQIEMKFTPLLKGLKIGKIKCTLVETHDWTIFNLHVNERHWKKSRDIANWTFEMNEEEHYQDMINDDGQDGWVLNETLPVPKSLKSCMQDVETPGIKIRHKVKFIVALENPDGHISEVRMSGKLSVCFTNNPSYEPVFR